MTADILECNYFRQTLSKTNSNKVIFPNTSCRASCNYDFKMVKSRKGILKNDNKSVLRYIAKILNYLLTGNELINENDHISYFDLKLNILKLVIF